MNTENMKVLITETDYFSRNPVMVSIEEYFNYKVDMKDLKVGNRILPNALRTKQDQEARRNELLSGELTPIFCEVIDIKEDTIYVRPNCGGTVIP
jgi:hypothetical protein